jgi:hypothetical protein
MSSHSFSGFNRILGRCLKVYFRFKVGCEIFCQRAASRKAGLMPVLFHSHNGKHFRIDPLPKRAGWHFEMLKEGNTEWQKYPRLIIGQKIF